VYSTNRQSEYVANGERYPGPAKVYKVTIHILVNNARKKRMLTVKWYVNCGMWSIGNTGYNYRTVMMVRYVEYTKEVKRPRINNAKVRNVRKYRSRKCKKEPNGKHGKYSKPTTALETLKIKRYKYIAGVHVYNRCIWSESIEVYIEEKAGGINNNVPERSKSIEYKYIAGIQVYKRCIMPESIKVYTDEKAGGNRYMEQVLDKSIKKGIVHLRLRPSQSGNIEATAVAQNELVCEAKKVSVLNKPNISVSVKMDQRVNSGDQAMETNPSQQAATSGEYCYLSVPSAPMVLCPVYVMFNSSNIHPSGTLHYNVLACYIRRMCRNCCKYRSPRKTYKLEVRCRPIIHIYVCNVRRNAINMTYVPKCISCRSMSCVVLEESSWYGRYGE
jgi:hypothetical protein